MNALHRFPFDIIGYLSKIPSISRPDLMALVVYLNPKNTRELSVSIRRGGRRFVSTRTRVRGMGGPARTGRHHLPRLVKHKPLHHVPRATVPLLMTVEAQAHQVVQSQRHTPVRDVLRRQLNDVMHFLGTPTAVNATVSVAAQCVLALLPPQFGEVERTRPGLSHSQASRCRNPCPCACR